MATDASSPVQSLSSVAATVGDVMRPAITTVEPGAHLAGAAYLMKRYDDTALVVTTDDAEHRPLAVVTADDISRAVADGLDLEDTRISTLPGREPVVVTPGTALLAAARTMLLHRIHHVPVVEDGRLVGIVDLADVCAPLVGRDG
jgi:CBS domain-containing protein